MANCCFSFLENEKVSLYDLNRVLNILLPYNELINVPKLTDTNLESLKVLHKRALDLNLTIDNAIHRAAMPRLKRTT